MLHLLLVDYFIYSDHSTDKFLTMVDIVMRSWLMKNFARISKTFIIIRGFEIIFIIL